MSNSISCRIIHEKVKDIIQAQIVDAEAKTVPKANNVGFNYIKLRHSMLDIDKSKKCVKS